MPWPPRRPTHCPRCGRTGAPPPWTSSSSCRPSRAACRWRARPRSSRPRSVPPPWPAWPRGCGRRWPSWPGSGRPPTVFEPQLPVELTDALHDVWRRAVEKSMGWAARNHLTVFLSLAASLGCVVSKPPARRDELPAGQIGCAHNAAPQASVWPTGRQPEGADCRREPKRELSAASTTAGAPRSTDAGEGIVGSRHPTPPGLHRAGSSAPDLESQLDRGRPGSRGREAL